MEQNRVIQILFGNVRIGEGIVGSGVMQKDPVDSRHRQYNRIGGSAVFIHDQTARAVERAHGALVARAVEADREPVLAAVGVVVVGRAADEAARYNYIHPR